MRRLPVDDDYYIASLNEFPPLLFTYQQLTDWAWTLCFVGMIYTIAGIAIVCEDYFVPCVDVIADKFQISEDIAGATWLAVGTSAPEIFTCFIGTFVAQSDVGFGTIIGSAIFNVGLIVGSCAIFTSGELKIQCWPFARDMLYLLLCLGVLALFFGGISRNEIHWWESLVLLLLYVLYVFLMKYNEQIKAAYFNKFVNTEKAKQLLTKPNGDYGANGHSRTATARLTIDVIVPNLPMDKTLTLTPMRSPAIAPRSSATIELSEHDLSTTKSVLISDMRVDKISISVTETSIQVKSVPQPVKRRTSTEYTHTNTYLVNNNQLCTKRKAVDISFPDTTWKRISFIIRAPLIYSIHFTCFDITKESNQSWWPWTFLVSILWLGGLSYLMVWWCICVGFAWWVPQEIMGLVFLAFGTSLPELITCVIVAKQGKPDMAIAGAVASNILNILVGLPLPWLTFALIQANLGEENIKIKVKAHGLFFSILVLIVMMAAVSVLVVINKWILTHCTGWAMITLYVMFVAQDLARYYLLDIQL